MSKLTIKTKIAPASVYDDCTPTRRDILFIFCLDDVPYGSVDIEGATYILSLVRQAILENHEWLEVELVDGNLCVPLHLYEDLHTLLSTAVDVTNRPFATYESELDWSPRYLEDATFPELDNGDGEDTVITRSWSPRRFDWEWENARRRYTVPYRGYLDLIVGVGVCTALLIQIYFNGGLGWLLQ